MISAGPKGDHQAVGSGGERREKSLRMWAPPASNVPKCVVIHGNFPSWASQEPTLQIIKNHVKFNTRRKHTNTPKVHPKPPKSDPNDAQK